MKERSVIFHWSVSGMLAFSLVFGLVAALFSIDEKGKGGYNYNEIDWASAREQECILCDLSTENRICGP